VAGFAELLDFVTDHAPGSRILWAMEGTRSYGVGLPRFLQRQGHQVIEVDSAKRPSRPGRGKSDALDAVRAARETLARDRHVTPRADGTREGLRVLLLARDSAVVARTATINALKALILTRTRRSARPAERPLDAGSGRACAGMRHSGRRRPDEHALMVALHSMGRRVLAPHADARQLERELRTQVRAVAPTLLAQPGVGPTVAAQLLVAWSHHGRVHSKAAFAKLAGVAPPEASSGQVTRFRLNRGGDRALNRALHMAVLSRLAHDPTTQAYQARRIAEGKSKAEIRPCLKRHLSRHLYRTMQALPQTP
jgi:transposase